ncbi:hypothetical protein VIC_002966 [Vibrio coralliilyticus ATCC BAA-450]|nr:hypothetical protein VIC_002966 [Vibrio coralliilyticus ATCC BAA-450]
MEHWRFSVLQMKKPPNQVALMFMRSGRRVIPSSVVAL